MTGTALDRQLGPGPVLYHVGNISGQPHVYAAGLRQSGIRAINVSWSDTPPYQLPADQHIYRSGDPAMIKGLKAAGWILRRAWRPAGYHFHSNTVLAPGLELPLYKLQGRPMIFHFWGSDIRLASVARTRNPYIVCPFSDEKAIRRKLALLARYVPAAIVADFELREYIEPYFQRIFILPQVIDAKPLRPRYPSPEQQRPLIVHIPSRMAVKGTAQIVAAIDRLRAAGAGFEFELLQGLTQAAARSRLANADIVIDEILSGTYGILAIEAMSLGKPVICFIRPDLRGTYPADLPIVSAGPGEVEQRLSDLIANGPLREDLGRKGRRFVERYHDRAVVMPRLIEIYRQAGFDLPIFDGIKDRKHTIATEKSCSNE